MNLTKNADPDKYKYFGYGFEIDPRSNFSVNGEWNKIFIILGEGNSLSVHLNNRKYKS